MAEIVRSFTVEHAGCPSCADRVRTALSPLGEVGQITIDEDADSADVVLRTRDQLDRTDVDAALAEASLGSGHVYRVADGSWRPD
jgi:Heavy-metal-associated domain